MMIHGRLNDVPRKLVVLRRGPGSTVYQGYSACIKPVYHSSDHGRSLFTTAREEKRFDEQYARGQLCLYVCGVRRYQQLPALMRNR